MKSSDILMDLRATMDEIERPWAAFIGLVTLHKSDYVMDDQIFALDSSRSGFPDLGQSVVLHPDTLPKARASATTATRRTMSDEELAAFLFWTAHQQGRLTTRD